MKRLLPLSLAFALACVGTATAASAPPGTRGQVLGDGVGYVSVVRLEHQPDAAANGHMLMVFERDGMAGIPLYESDNGGAHWRFLSNVTDQVHGKDADPFFEEDLEAARALVASTDRAELFLYPGEEHLFTDASLPEYDAEAAALLTTRVLAFLDAVQGTPTS